MRVAATGGCFDIIHDAHINVLKTCRKIGGQVVVFLNSDESTARIKGEGKPAVPLKSRAEVLRSIKYVDSIIVFHEDTPAEAIRHYFKLNPELNTGDFFWVKGADSRLTGLPDDEKNAIQENAGMILYYDNPSDTHSNDIKGRIAMNHKDEQEVAD